MTASSTNIASLVRDMAQVDPFKRAVVCSSARDHCGNVAYTQLTYAQLERDSDRLAWGCLENGIERGTRVLVMVRPGLDFVSLAFALFKVGAVPVLIDPGMGVRNMLGCVQDSKPEVFFGVPKAHLLRKLYPRSFRSVARSYYVGGKRLLGGSSLSSLRSANEERFPIVEPEADELAGIFFTSGSTGAPKGVEYIQRQMLAQARLLQEQYDIQPSEIDLPTFPLFVLFCPAFGVTAVIPDMDPSRPAGVDPKKIVEAIHDQGVTHSFGSPALWNVVSRYCVENGIELPSVKRILIAGAPVAGSVLQRCAAILPNGEVFTPYGATEALPVCSIGSSEILTETQAKAAQGHGTCVGTPFPGLEVEIIGISEQPIAEWSSDLILPAGEVGEIAVKGPIVTKAYLNRPSETKHAKIADGAGLWHRMGDLGYKDDQGRLWFCGRKKHRVIASGTPYYSVMVEGVFNAEEDIWRTALVGIPEGQTHYLALCIEFQPGKLPQDPERSGARKRQLASLAGRYQIPIKSFLFYPGVFPVDRRHNAKIEREQLAVWAQRQIEKGKA